MRIAKVLETLLGITGIVVQSAEVGSEGVVFDVRPRRKKPRCSGCGKRAPGYDQREARQWRHLNLGATRIWLRYAPRPVGCARCGVVNEQVPWGSAAGWFSATFEETTAYLARVADKTSVTKIMGIAWVTVGRIVERIVGERLDRSRLDGLSFIGIDEFSYRKRHHYISVIVDHVTGRVVWAAKGRSSETLAAFFRELGPERAAKIEVVTLDMAEIKAVKEYAPQAQIVFDRFHVQRLASDAVDQVRRALVGNEDDPERKRAIKGSRFSLLRSEWNLTVEDRAKISEIQRSNRPLYRAYLLKQALAHLLGYQHAGHAKKALKEWLSWASRSRLRPYPSRGAHDTEVPRRHPRLHRFPPDERARRGNQQPNAHCRSPCLRLFTAHKPSSRCSSSAAPGSNSHPLYPVFPTHLGLRRSENMNDKVGYRLDSDADRRLRRFKRSAAFDRRASILGAVMLRSSTALLALTAAIASSAISVRPAIAADSPPEVVRKLTDAVIAVLKQKDLPAAARVTKIRDVVYDYADFPTISRLVLARNWRGLDETQQERFVEEFKKYLSISYGKNVDTYNNEKVEIVGDRDEGRDDWTVQTKNLRPQGGGDVLVEYRLRQRNGEWKIIDVLIERVSLVSNYRSQFQAIMANGGIDRLLELLREKNASGEGLKS